jgi:rhodanese-related sulfurtransferase
MCLRGGKNKLSKKATIAAPIVLVSAVVVYMLFIAPMLSRDNDEKSLHQTITAAQAKEMMDSGKPFILLDVRTDEEYNEKRIDGAILISDYEIADKAEDALTDKDATILVYCRSGRRSALAAAELARMGYTDVYDFGGIIDWPYETVSGT